MSGKTFMSDLVTLDTNILIYAVDRDSGKKHKKALDILEWAVESDAVLTLQSLSEFFYAATRKGHLSATEAKSIITDWQSLFPVVTARETVLIKAVDAIKNHSMSFWDAFLWATAKEAGVTLVYSEDYQEGRVVEGIKYVNPFVPDL